MALTHRPTLLALLAFAVAAEAAQRSREAARPRGDLKELVQQAMEQCLGNASDVAAKRACRQEVWVQFQNTAGDMRRPEQTAYFQRFERDAAEGRVREAMRECLGEEEVEAAQARACIQEKRGRLDAELPHFLEEREEAEEAEEEQRREGRRRHVEREATREVVADLLARCLRAARQSGRGMEAAKRACSARVAGALSASSLGESTDTVLQKHWAKKLMGPAEECESSLAECRRQAREDAISSGMERQAYVVTRQMAEIKAAATVWASCKEAGEANEDCDEVALEEFLRVSGASAEAFTDKLRSKVRNLGRAIWGGRPLTMVRRKRMLVSALTDGLECNGAAMELFAERALNVSREADSAVGDIVERFCRLVDAAPEHRVLLGTDFSDEGIANLSTAVVSALDGYSLASRRLGEGLPRSERRLESIAEVFAAQDVAECGEADAACADDDTLSELLPTPSTPTSAAAPQAAAAAALALAAALGL